MANIGFKKLTVDNWLDPDEALKMFVSISPDGQPPCSLRAQLQTASLATNLGGRCAAKRDSTWANS